MPPADAMGPEARAPVVPARVRRRERAAPAAVPVAPPAVAPVDAAVEAPVRTLAESLAVLRACSKKCTRIALSDASDLTEATFVGAARVTIDFCVQRCTREK